MNLLTPGAVTRVKLRCTILIGLVYNKSMKNLKRGSKIILPSFESLPPQRVTILEIKNRQAIVVVSPQDREEDDVDGLSEVFLDSETYETW
jgi:hypothetical protein